MAPRDVRTGRTYAAQLNEAIDQSSAMVVLVTPSACESQFVHAEVERAFKRRLPLYPMRFEAVEPTGDLAFFLSSMQWIDAFGPDRDESFERLAHDLGGQVPVDGGYKPTPPPPELARAQPAPSHTSQRPESTLLSETNRNLFMPLDRRNLIIWAGIALTILFVTAIYLVGINRKPTRAQGIPYNPSNTNAAACAPDCVEGYNLAIQDRNSISYETVK